MFFHCLLLKDRVITLIFLITGDKHYHAEFRPLLPKAKILGAML